jgi:hypothetical protein
MSTRACGACSLCCKIMAVPDFEGKPDQHKWCKYAKPGYNACTIYQQRPQECRAFNCMWLISDQIPDYWYPKLSKIVINPKLELGSGAYVAFVVDPACPGRWREEPWFSDIKKMASAGLEGRGGQKWTTVVLIGDQRVVIGQ